MNATRKTLTILAAAAALAGGVSIAQTSAPSADATTNAGAAPSTPSTSADTSSSTLSNSSSTDSSTLSSSTPAPQADRN